VRPDGRSPTLKAMTPAIAALILFATPAAAADQAVDKTDVRCLAVSVGMAGLDDPDLAQAGVMSSLYFAGKLEGAHPKADVMLMAVEELLVMKPSQIEEHRQICATILADKSREWTSRGAELQRSTEAGERGDP